VKSKVYEDGGLNVAILGVDAAASVDALVLQETGKTLDVTVIDNLLVILALGRILALISKSVSYR